MPAEPYVYAVPKESQAPTIATIPDTKRARKKPALPSQNLNLHRPERHSDDTKRAVAG
jgi:hypothetical protein